MQTIELNVTEKEKIIVNNNVAISNSKHTRVEYKDRVCIKPWGHEFLAYESGKLGIWFLKINKGHGTSLHTHFHKDTLIIVIHGCAKINLIDGVQPLNKLQSMYIPKGKFHGISSFSDEVYLMEIEIFDASVGFTDKNDLLRIDDIYHRSSTGYASSVTVVSEGLSEFNYFWVADGLCLNMFDTEITVGQFSRAADNSNYNVIISGEIYANGLYMKEGSNIACVDRTRCTASPGAIILSIKNTFCGEDSKIVYSNAHLELISNKLKADNKKVILTSGCYDILHVGHLNNLKRAKSLGDVLIVCLSSDEQIRILKGVDRPINNYEDRINLFKTIACVDYIVLYNEADIVKEETLGSIIKIVDPFCWTKGDDYTTEAILEKHPYIKNIMLFENVHGKSTTNIIKRIRTT
jgi:rfaE bifunctional protein nucleotidyltransferase chain/domain